MRHFSPDAADASEPDRDRLGWSQEGLDLLRGVAAGAIVGMPLLFTMEMWWRGMTASPLHLLVLLVVLLAVNGVVCIFSGFRHETSLAAAAAEAVTSMGIGLVLAAAVLALIGELQADPAIAPAVAKILITATPVSLGVSFANAHIRGSGRAGNGDDNDAKDDDGPTPGQRILSATSRQIRQDLAEAGASLSGASLFAFNVAPTEEVLMIAARLSAWQHLLIMAASLVLCYIIVFAAGFKERRVHVPSLFQHPVTETLLAYAVSLAVSMGMLWLIGMPEVMDHPAIFVKTTVTLGLVAVVGASAGRLVV